mmetsp:Transcript_6805/g.14530  ORF Transcript_6805/g.14530 Transcript_6805/m.14530 type:complete len:234 (-) Transcript_6805:1238-1939(-)
MRLKHAGLRLHKLQCIAAKQRIAGVVRSIPVKVAAVPIQVASPPRHGDGQVGVLAGIPQHRQRDVVGQQEQHPMLLVSPLVVADAHLVSGCKDAVREAGRESGEDLRAVVEHLGITLHVVKHDAVPLQRSTTNREPSHNGRLRPLGVDLVLALHGEHVRPHQPELTNTIVVQLLPVEALKMGIAPSQTGLARTSRSSGGRRRCGGRGSGSGGGAILSAPFGALAILHAHRSVR